MATLKSDQLSALIESGKIGPLYAFDGSENWLKEKAVGRIIKRLIPMETRDFNLDRLDGSTSSAAEIINAASGLPVLSERRLVVVSQADELSSADSKAVAEFLPQLPSSTCLIFLYDGKASLREVIPAQAGSLGAIVTFWPPYPNQWPSLVMNEARLRGKTMGFDAASILSGACEDLQQMSMEMEKLALFVGAKNNIDREDLKRHGLPDQGGDYDELEAALFSRDSREALQQAHRMLESGIRPESLLAVFERVFRNLIISGYQRSVLKAEWEQVFDQLGLRAKGKKEAVERGLKNYSDIEIKNSLEAVTQADYEIKTGVLTGPVALTFLILKLCGSKGGKDLSRSVTSRF